MMIEAMFLKALDLTDKLATGVRGKVVVIDIPFGSSKNTQEDEKTYQETTRKFILALGERLVRWFDHHPHRHWDEFKNDARFILKSKKQAPACALLIRPELVCEVDTIIAHDHFDGLISAAKYVLNGQDPYPGASHDAIVAENRVGELSKKGNRFKAALRAEPVDNNMRQAIFRELISARRSALVDMAALKYGKIEFETLKLAQQYVLVGRVAIVYATEADRFDLAMLLVIGQALAKVAIVKVVSQRSGNEVLKIAGSKEWDFVTMFDLAGGVPNRVTLPAERMEEVLYKINQG